MSSWTDFRHEHEGEGLSTYQLRQMYYKTNLPFGRTCGKKTSETACNAETTSVRGLKEKFHACMWQDAGNGAKCVSLRTPSKRRPSSRRISTRRTSTRRKRRVTKKVVPKKVDQGCNSRKTKSSCGGNQQCEWLEGGQTCIERSGDIYQGPSFPSDYVPKVE